VGAFSLPAQKGVQPVHALTQISKKKALSNPRSSIDWTSCPGQPGVPRGHTVLALGHSDTMSAQKATDVTLNASK